jgi:hypothetical protein
VRPRFRLIGDADDLQTVFSILALEFDEIGHFRAARRAPRRPEINEHHLATVVAQSHCPPLDALEREGRGTNALTKSGVGQGCEHKNENGRA